MPGPDDSGQPPRLVVVVGTSAEAAGCRDGDRVRLLRDPDEAGAVLDDELPRLGTGWRILVVGTGRDARTVRAAALARGALDEEVAVLVRDGSGRASGVRVRCGVCHTTSHGRIGETLSCPGCGVPLVVTDHESPVHGAVLGAPRVP